MRKGKGPKEKPCETSACINFQLEDSQFKAALWSLLRRNESIKSKLLPIIPQFFSLNRGPSC